jgi:hypothetical protein
MANPQQRPGFSRVDTDMMSGIELQPTSNMTSPSKAPLSSGLEIPESDSKTNPINGDIKELSGYQDSDDYSVHEGTTGDYVAREHKIVETAEDIVNQVLSVEDDPTLNPWTFRMFFL